MTTHQKYVATATGMSLLTAPKFAPGMLLQDDDLDHLSKYTQELSRLLFRSLFGCGVVCGLVVSVDCKCGKLIITVADGVALDCCGDPVQVPKPQTIPVDASCDPAFPDCLWVVLCGKRKCCAPRPAMCSDDDEDPTVVCTRERYAFEIRVVRARPACVCGCPEPQCAYECEEEEKPEPECKCWCVDPESECYADHYAGKCTCSCGDCSGCDCDCILLARLDNCGDYQSPDWKVDHRVRRFVRPVLIEDPQVRCEREAAKYVAAAQAPAAAAAPAPAPEAAKAAKVNSKSRRG